MIGANFHEGQPRYCSPEAANFEPRNSSSDIWSLGCVFLELVKILKGETIDSMKEFFATHGSRSQFFRSNPGAIKEWTQVLIAEGAEFDNVPMNWIQEC